LKRWWRLTADCSMQCHGVGVSLKVGDKYWEDWRGGSGEGLCPPQLWVWGLAPRKKKQFCVKIMQFWASFGTSFLYYRRKWGNYPQSWKWGTYPLSPCSDAYGSMLWRRKLETLGRQASIFGSLGRRMMTYLMIWGSVLTLLARPVVADQTDRLVPGWLC